MNYQLILFFPIGNTRSQGQAGYMVHMFGKVYMTRLSKHTIGTPVEDPKSRKRKDFVGRLDKELKNE